MDDIHLNHILEEHKKWLESGWCRGGPGNLVGANLADRLWDVVNLKAAHCHGVNFSGGYFKEAQFEGALLAEANFRGSTLREAKFYNANLREANFTSAILDGAKFNCANLYLTNFALSILSSVDFRQATLSGANFYGADLKGSNFEGADLTGVNFAGAVLPDFQIPQNVELVGYKKVFNTTLAEFTVITLKIPKDAKRTGSLVGNKCRAEFVVVMDAPSKGKLVSMRDGETRYIKGRIVRPDGYNDDFRHECTQGVHFFLKREDAEEFTL